MTKCTTTWFCGLAFLAFGSINILPESKAIESVSVFETVSPFTYVEHRFAHQNVALQPGRLESITRGLDLAREYFAEGQPSRQVRTSIAFLTDDALVYSVKHVQQPAPGSQSLFEVETTLGYVLLNLKSGEAEVIEIPDHLSADALFHGRSTSGEDLWLDGDRLYIGSRALALPAIPAKMSDRYSSPYVANEWRTYAGIFLSAAQECFAFATEAFSARGEGDAEASSNRVFFSRSFDKTPHEIELPGYYTGIELTALGSDCALALSLYDVRDSRWHVALYRHDALDLLTLPRIINEHHVDILGASEGEDSSGGGIGRFRIIHLFDDDLFLLRRVRPNTMFGSNPELNDLALSSRTQAAFLTFSDGLPFEEAQHYPSYGSAALVLAGRAQEHSPLMRITKRQP